MAEKYVSVEALFEKTTRRNHIWDAVTNAEGKGLTEIVNDIPPADVRLIVLPCKVGDVVYFLRRRFDNSVEIVLGRISMLQQKADLSWKFRVTEGGSVFDRKMDELGKNAFLTREEAEAALRKEGAK